MNHIHYEINLQYENTELRKCLSQLSVVDTQLTFCLGSWETKLQWKTHHIHMHF